MGSIIATGAPLYFAALVSFLVASLVAARQNGLPSWRVLVLAIALVAAFLLGARLHYLVAHRNLALADGAGGLFGKGAHMPGGIALGALVGLLGAWILRLPIARFGDALMPAFGIGVLLLRLGCFVNGCCFGVRTDLPWGVRFAKGTGAFTVHMNRGWLPDGAAFSLPVHPTQLYFASVGLLILLIGLTWGRFQRRGGETWLLAVAVWGFANPLVESFRDPSYLTGTPHLAMAGVVIGVTALAAFLVLRYGHFIRTPADTPAALPSIGSVG